MLSPIQTRLAAVPRGVAHDQRGVAAVEFAFIAPLMVLLFFGLAQLSEAIIASRHTGHVAATLGDLTSQCSNVNDTDFTNIFAAAGDIMSPLPVSTTVLGQRVTSVSVVDSKGDTQAQWSKAQDSSGLTTAYTPGAAVPVPANIVTNQGDNVLMAETVYKYTFPISAGGVMPMGTNSVSLAFGQSINFDIKTYYKPRKSANVVYTGTGSGGTGSSNNTQGTSCYSS
jgi:Flp pilus assembly protein TadG